MRAERRLRDVVALLAVLPVASYSFVTQFGPQVHRQHHEWRGQQQRPPLQPQQRHLRQSSPRCDTAMALAPAASAMMNNMASASQAVYTSQVTLPSLQMLVLKARAGFLVLAAKMKLATALMSTSLAGFSATPLVGAAAASGIASPVPPTAAAAATAAAHSLPFGIEWSTAAFQTLPLEAHGALGALLFILLQNALTSIGEATASRRRAAAAVATATRAVPPGANAAAISNVYWAAKSNQGRVKKPAATVVAEERDARGGGRGGDSGDSGDSGGGSGGGNSDRSSGTARTVNLMRGGAALAFTHHITHGLTRLQAIPKLELSSQIEDWQRRVFYSSKDQ